LYVLCASALLRAAPAQAQETPKEGAASQVVPRGEPSSEELFRVESEASQFRRWTEEAQEKKLPAPMPPPQQAVGGPCELRDFPPAVAVVEPSYVCYRRPYFEQINAERYGWDLGPIHPVVSLGVFWFDVATFPYHLGTDPCRHCECDAGYCLPGDHVPLLLYPPEVSGTGALAEGATIAALLAIFP
jgi:hypothetical protein